MNILDVNRDVLFYILSFIDIWPDMASCATACRGFRQAILSADFYAYAKRYNMVQWQKFYIMGTASAELIDDLPGSPFGLLIHAIDMNRAKLVANYIYSYPGEQGVIDNCVIHAMQNYKPDVIEAIQAKKDSAWFCGIRPEMLLVSSAVNIKSFKWLISAKIIRREDIRYISGKPIIAKGLIDRCVRGGPEYIHYLIQLHLRNIIILYIRLLMRAALHGSSPDVALYVRDAVKLYYPNKIYSFLDHGLKLRLLEGCSAKHESPSLCSRQRRNSRIARCPLRRV